MYPVKIHNILRALMSLEQLIISCCLRYWSLPCTQCCVLWCRKERGVTGVLITRLLQRETHSHTHTLCTTRPFDSSLSWRECPKHWAPLPVFSPSLHLSGLRQDRPLLPTCSCCHRDTVQWVTVQPSSCHRLKDAYTIKDNTSALHSSSHAPAELQRRPWGTVCKTVYHTLYIYMCVCISHFVGQRVDIFSKNITLFTSLVWKSMTKQQQQQKSLSVLISFVKY